MGKYGSLLVAGFSPSIEKMKYCYKGLPQGTAMFPPTIVLGTIVLLKYSWEQRKTSIK